MFYTIITKTADVRSTKKFKQIYIAQKNKQWEKKYHLANFRSIDLFS